ncbi:MAG: magnesium chelatase subunit D [Woeseiaceae bacterium]
MTTPSIPAAEIPGLLAAVLAVGGHSLGGIVLQGPSSPARDHWLSLYRSLNESECAWRRVPVNVGEDRLLGGLDLAASLASSRVVTASGLLAEANDGVLLLCMAERQGSSVISAVCTALDDRQIRLERDGIARIEPSSFCVVANDESVGDDEMLDPRLRDRLALTMALTIEGNDGFLAPFDDQDCERARTTLNETRVPDSVYQRLLAIADALAVKSPRPVLHAVQVARCLAALNGRTEVCDADVSSASLLTFVLRIPGALDALQQPQEASPEEPPAPPPEAPDADDSADDSASAEQRNDQNQPMEDQVDDAAAAVLPPELLAQLSAMAQGLRQKKRSGKSGEATKSIARGRPLRSIAGIPSSGKRLDVLATLKTAAPMQTIRRAKRSAAAPVFSVQKDDLRIRRYQQKTRTTTIFVVDASGSAAVQRLAETKGAIEILLAECYVRRDQVALVVFRREDAELLLPATRSLVRAKRSLAALPGGGATPLADGLRLGLAEAMAAQKRGESPQLVLLSDARANIGLAGERDPTIADAHAIGIAQDIRASGVGVLSIDTGRRPGKRAIALAEALGATYLALPFADATSVSNAVKQVL